MLQLMDLVSLVTEIRLIVNLGTQSVSFIVKDECLLYM